MVLWCHGWGYKQLQKAPHIHIISIQSVLAPWYAVDGHMGAPLHWYLCKWGWMFRKLGCGRGQTVLWFHGWGYKQLQTASHIHIICIQKCFSTLICCGWTYGCTLTLLYLCKWGGNLGKLGCGWEQMVLWCHGWVYKQLQTAYPTSIPYVYKVFWHLDMLWIDIWVHPYTVILVQMGVNFWKVGVWVRANGVVVSWLRLQTALEGIPHPYRMYTKCFSTLICCGWTYGCTLTL